MNTNQIEDTELLKDIFFLPARKVYSRREREANRRRQMEEVEERRKAILELAEREGISFLLARRRYLAVETMAYER
jgi:hypothetical protein